MGKKISTPKVEQKVLSSKQTKKRAKKWKDPAIGTSIEPETYPLTRAERKTKNPGSSKVAQFIKDSHSSNDISWYTHYPDLVNDVGSVFMSRPNGQDYPKTNAMTDAVSASDYSSKQGGFMRVYVQPSWGGFSSSLPVANNAINVAASKLYYYTVHGNSRNTSYDKGDLMKAFMTFDSLAMVIAEAKRVYAFIKAQDLNNRWVRHIVEGLGWNYDDLTDNVVQFRAQINLVVEKFNQISLPDLFDIFKAHVDMFRNVYRDRTGAKCQYSAAISGGVWLFSDEFSRMDYVTHGTLNGSPFIWDVTNGYDRRLRTVNDFSVVANYMLSTIYDSTDIGEIRADILMAFKDTPMITASMVVDDMDLPISYDEEWNLKLHNVELVKGDVGVSFSLDTTPNTTELFTHACYVDDPVVNSGNIVYYNITNTTTNPIHGTPWENDSHIMDLPDHIKTDRDAILLMQQFKVSKRVAGSGAIIPKSETAVGYEQFVCAAFAVEKITYIYNVNSNFVQLNEYNSVTYETTNHKQLGALTTTLTSASMLLTSMLKMFEFGVTLPVQHFIYDASNATYKFLPMLYEVENLTVYSDDVLYNILHTCIESLFFNSKFYNA